ncbi:MAG: hybrid sensor histidine kinase/response regulator, partial [Acidobacteria bacterium]|nr:hybrid sensor histidine kinase/response regulator [Acidobacteriota bacterium]
LDMNMPGMGGAEVLPRILELRPGLQVILATGFSDHEVAPLMEGRSEVFSLRKPFSLKEFQQKISTLRFPLAAAGNS